MYRDQEDALGLRLGELERELPEIREEKRLLDEQSGHRERRREELMLVEGEVAALHKRIASIGTPRARRLHRKRFTNRDLAQLALGGAMTLGGIIFLLSDNAMIAGGFAAVPIVIGLLVASGWRGEGL